MKSKSKTLFVLIVSIVLLMSFLVLYVAAQEPVAVEETEQTPGTGTILKLDNALELGVASKEDQKSLASAAGRATIGPDQTNSACAPGLVEYRLEATNEDVITDTIDISTIVGNFWPVTIAPQSLVLGPGSTDTVSVSVEIPWYAEAGDTQVLSVTGTAQTSGLVDETALETMADLAAGWGDLAPSPHGARYLAVVYEDGHLYQIGGNDDGGYHDGTYAYDIATNAWLTMTSMLTATYHMDGAAIGGDIYVPGGQTAASNWNAFVQVYSTANDTWSTVAPMPVPVRYQEVVAYDGLLYVLGGQTTGSIYTDTVQIYDPAVDSWSLGTPMNIPVAYAASGVIAGKIYLAGGYNGSYQTALQIYDPATDGWSFGADMGYGWVQAADAVKHNRYLILAGGYYESTTTASSFAWFYDAVNDAWHALPFANSLRYAAEGDSDGSEFYYVAGREYDGTFFYSNRAEQLVQCAAPEPKISIDDGPLSIPTCPGDTELLDFKVCNEGDAPLSFNITEMASGASLAGSLDFRPVGSQPAEAPPASPLPKDDLSVYQPFEGEVVLPEAPQERLAVLWDQPITTTSLGAFASQDFDPALDAFDIFIADDFANSDWWAIDTIYVPGDTWNTGGDLDCAELFHWEIYADAGGVPAGDPWGGGDAPVWTYYGSTADPNIAFSTGVSNFKSNVTLSLDVPITLPPGDWWLVFYPSMAFANCFQYGRHVSATENNAPAQVINPGGGFGFPAIWTSVQVTSTWGQDYHDFAFRLEGVALEDVPWLSEDPPTGALEGGQCTTVDVHLDATGLLPGEYSAELIVGSNDPDTPSISLPVSLTVWTPAQILDVAHDMDLLEVAFGATVVGREPIGFSWDFGDGGTSTLPDPVHTFTAYTCYPVALTVDNACASDFWSADICLELPRLYLPLVMKTW
jgi:N-acetylneuraminic acid mutarotase